MKAAYRRESLRSIIISQHLLRTREIAVFRHTGCGMLTFTSEQARRIVKDAYPGDNTVSQAMHELDFLEFSNLEESVKADVQFLKENDLVPKETTITGWIYDVDTGKVKQSSLPQETCVLTLLLRLVRLRSSYPVPSNLIPDVLSTVTLCFQVLVTIPYPNMYLRLLMCDLHNPLLNH